MTVRGVQQVAVFLLVALAPLGAQACPVCVSARGRAEGYLVATALMLIPAIGILVVSLAWLRGEAGRT